MSSDVSDFDLSLPDSVEKKDRRVQPERRLSSERRESSDCRGLQTLSTSQLIKSKLDKIGLLAWQNWVGRSCFALCYGICILTLVWSYTYRLSLLEQTDSSVNQQQVLESSLLELQDTWTSGEYHLLHDQVGDLYRHVLPDYQALAIWLSELTNKANDMGLQLDYLIGEAQSVATVDKVMMVPVSMSLKKLPRAADKAYRNSLNFLHLLLREKWRLDFDSLRMDSQGEGVENVEVRLGLWVRSQHTVVPTDQMAEDIEDEQENTDTFE